MMDIEVTERMKKAGSDMAAVLHDVSVVMNLTDAATFKMVFDRYEKKHEDILNSDMFDVVKAYANGDIDSVTGIYIAMQREYLKEKE